MTKADWTSVDLWLKRGAVVLAALVGVAALLVRLSPFLLFANHSHLWHSSLTFSMLGGLVLWTRRLFLPWLVPACVAGLYFISLCVNAEYYTRIDTYGFLLITGIVSVWGSYSIRIRVGDELKEIVDSLELTLPELLGVASFAISVVTVVALSAVLGPIPSRLHGHEVPDVIFVAAVLGELLVAAVGFGLGVVGVVQRNRRRLFTILGVLLNATALLLTGWWWWPIISFLYINHTSSR